MLGIMLLMLHELFVQKYSGVNVVSLRFWRASIRALKRSIATAIATSSRRHHEPHAQYTPCALSLTFVRVRPQAAEAVRLTSSIWTAFKGEEPAHPKATAANRACWRRSLAGTELGTHRRAQWGT